MHARGGGAGASPVGPARMLPPHLPRSGFRSPGSAVDAGRPLGLSRGREVAAAFSSSTSFPFLLPGKESPKSWLLPAWPLPTRAVVSRGAHPCLIPALRVHLPTVLSRLWNPLRPSAPSDFATSSLMPLSRSRLCYTPDRGYHFKIKEYSFQVARTNVH